MKKNNKHEKKYSDKSINNQQSGKTFPKIKANIKYLGALPPGTYVPTIKPIKKKQNGLVFEEDLVDLYHPINLTSVQKKNIEIQDIVIRRSVFKCMNAKHHLIDVNGRVEVIDNAGNISIESLPAGYCEECGHFFILQSAYENIKKKGTILCKIKDEKTYYKNVASNNGMMLAEESILMQYGYNVNQSEGMTDARRQKLLATLVDRKIMTRNEIVSYIDFFINQKKLNPIYTNAVSKWSRDRSFIGHYKSGVYDYITASDVVNLAKTDRSVVSNYKDFKVVIYKRKLQKKYKSKAVKKSIRFEKHTKIKTVHVMINALDKVIYVHESLFLPFKKEITEYFYGSTFINDDYYE